HGSTVRLAVARRASGVARVDVLQSAVGRRVEGLRPVARFRGVHGSFTWDGRANVRGARVRDGYVVVRFSEPLAGGATDVRSAALERSHGRFRARPGFARAAGCGLLRAYSLSGPAFGGTGGRALAISH